VGHGLGSRTVYRTKASEDLDTSVDKIPHGDPDGFGRLNDVGESDVKLVGFRIRFQWNVVLMQL